MIKIILKNWPVKLFCLFAAFGLWFYVALNQNLIAKFPGEIKIRAINVPLNLTAVYDDKEVEVKIGAAQVDWQKLSADAFSASIDLAGLAEGTHEVPVNVISTVSGITIIDKTPGKILVRLEPIITRELTVAKKIEGNAADGMVASSVEFTPEKVQVRGAKSIIDNLEEATALVKLAGQSVDFNENVSVSILDSKNNEIPDIEITPNEISASIHLIKGSNVKTVGIKPTISGEPKSGFYISEITVDPSVVEITGQRNIINEIKYIETAPVNIGGLSSVLEKDVNIVIPDSVTLIGLASEKVRIKISISPVLASREFLLSNFQLRNAGDFKISSVNPADFKVTISGSPEVLNSISASDILFTANLSSYDPSASQSVDYAVQPGDFSLPDGSMLVSYTADRLVIKLTK